MRQGRGIFSGVVLIFLLVTGLIAVLVVSTEVSCQRRFDNLLPIYPDAEIVDQGSSFLSTRYIELFIPNQTSVDVRTWYNKTAGLASRDQPHWEGDLLIEAADDRSGTRVLLYVTCP